MAYGTLRHKDGKFIVKAQPHVLLRLKRVFGKVGKKQFDTISLPDTIDTARDLEWFIQRYPLVLEPNTEQRLRDRAGAHRERESLVERILAGFAPMSDFQMAEPARVYQKQAAEVCLASGSLLLVDEMGLGKTIVAICLLTMGATRPALVVVPKSVQLQWQRQIKRFAPQLSVHILKKSKPYDFARKRGAKKSQGTLPLSGLTPDVLISTYHKLPGWAETLGPILNTVVFDEVQELRNGTDTAKGAAAASISAHVSYRLGLTGTPIYNYGDEMFNVVNIIRDGALGTKAEFCNEWCGGGGNKVTDPKALGSYLRAEGIMMRRTRDDVGLEIPPFERVFHAIDCDTEPLEQIEASARALAHRFLNEKQVERGDHMRAAEELSVMVRHATGVAKAPHVADFVRMLIESGEPVVLYGWHHDVYEVWRERLKEYRPVFITGKETANQKDESLQAFVKGESRVIIISLRAAAGLDGLQHAARVAVYGELDYSPGVHEQCDFRLNRDGQKRPVLAYYLESEGGSDPIVATILKKKGEQLTGLRDPDAELFEKLQTTGDHIRQLAERYLASNQVAAE